MLWKPWLVTNHIATAYFQRYLNSYISLLLFGTTTIGWTSRNFLVAHFMEEMTYVWIVVHFFFTAAHCHIGGPTSICHFLRTATKFSFCSLNKQMSPLILIISRSFSRWASLACCLLSLFLCVSLSLYSKFVDMTTLICKLNTLGNMDTETISAFLFCLYWLFSDVFASQDMGGYTISHQNNLELHLV